MKNHYAADLDAASRETVETVFAIPSERCTPLKRGVNENELAAQQTFVLGASGLRGGLGAPNQRYFARLRAKFSRRSRPFSMFAMLVA